MYFMFFAYGYLLGTDAGIWAQIKRLRWWTLGFAIVAFGMWLWVGGTIATFMNRCSGYWPCSAGRISY